MNHSIATFRPTRPTRMLFLSMCLLSCGLASSCTQDDSAPLALDDLDAAEKRFVTRFVVLERARAVALVDATVGPALLDSLAAEWGDSSGVELQRGLPADPRRLAAVHDLLARILTAEQDSLIKAPRPDRLGAPLPHPTAPPSGD